MNSYLLITAYKILGVHRESTEEEIKARYRQLCMQLHPDRPGADAAKFLEVQGAWNALKGVAPLYRIKQMEFLGVGCPTCDALGVHRTTKKFKTVAVRACNHCGGSGYLLPENRSQS